MRWMPPPGSPSFWGAPVYQQSVPQGAHFLSEHPCFMGALTRSQPQVRRTLAPYDLIVSLGADFLRMSVWSETDPLPEHLAVVQIGLRDWELAKNYPAEIAALGDVGETLAALNPMLAERLGASRRERIAALAGNNWSANRRRAADALADMPESAGPIPPAWLCKCLAEDLPDDGIVVDEGITTGARLLDFLPFRDANGYFGNVSGGIGWGIAAAVGVQIAQPRRRTVALIGDGSAMYSIQALWTAANAKLPVVFVIANNGGYRILKDRMKAFHDNDAPIGMDFRESAHRRCAACGRLRHACRPGRNAGRLPQGLPGCARGLRPLADRGHGQRRRLNDPATTSNASSSVVAAMP